MGIKGRGVAWIATLAVAGSAHAASLKASSTLTSTDGVKHPPEAAFDGDLTTAWAEDETGAGEGAWIELRLDAPVEVRSVSLWPGDLSKGERSLKENGRPHTVRLTLDDGKGGVVEETWRVRDGAEHGIQRVDVPIVGLARTVRVTIEQAYAGYIHNDLYLSEIAVNFTDGEVPGADALEAWRTSPAGETAEADHREAVIARFAAVTADDALGDREAFAALEGWAANGAPHWRARVARTVPLGFRAQAVRPDDVAIDALLKIKDPNAIPALTLASLRSHGRDARRLAAVVGYFEAFAELKGGGRRALAPWGALGWEPGALRGLGEPLGIGLGVYGDLYVADTANHRVSVFGPDGRLRATWGDGEPTVTRTWLGGDRPHYVAGRSPSTAEVGFTAPLDLDLVSTKDADTLVVVDAEGWVRVFDDQGALRTRWRARGEMAPAAGYGGAAHVVFAKGQVVVIQGTTGMTFTAEGEEVARWEIEAGAPVTAVGLRNGRIVLGFRNGAGMYDAGGRRLATFVGETDLPLGYEAWSLAADEKGKVWALTDHGWAVQFARPGKVARAVQVAPRGLPIPRFVVREDLLFVTSADGTIQRFDVPAIAAAQAADAP